MIFSPPHFLDTVRWEGLRIGLMGGSFNPPHAGHVHISNIALHSMNLHAIWWLVTPHNPLKDQSILMDYADRVALCYEITAPHPHIVVSELEKEIGEKQSFYTIKALTKAFSRSQFVWITGMDNALTMHKWYRWQDLLAMVPTAHIARPPAQTLIAQCPLKMLQRQRHIYLDSACKVTLEPHTTYWLMQKKMLGISSTEIRENASLTNR